MTLSGNQKSYKGIELVQQVLKKKGFYYGECDGVFSPRTKTSIMLFQICNCCEDPHGFLDEETCDLLTMGY